MADGDSVDMTPDGQKQDHYTTTEKSLLEKRFSKDARKDDRKPRVEPKKLTWFDELWREFKRMFWKKARDNR